MISKKMITRRRDKEFIEKMGLVIIIVAIAGMGNADISTSILYVIHVFLTAVVFSIGLFMYVFTDKLLKLQYKSMEHKKHKDKVK